MASHSSSNISSSSSTSALSCKSDKVRYGSRKVYLLTSLEYQHSLEDLLGLDFNVAANLPANSEIDFYANQIFTPIGETYFNAYLETANTVAEWAVSHQFKTRLNCTAYAECQTAFIQNFLPKIFRRPITNEEKTAFTTLFKNDYSGGEINEALKLALNTALTSSSFLYRTELGGPLVEEPAYEYDGSGYTAVAPIESKGHAEDINRNRKYLNFKFFAEGTLIHINVKAQAANDIWPVMSVEAGNKKVLIPVK